MKVMVTALTSDNARGQMQLRGATLTIVPEDFKDQIIEDWLKQHKERIKIILADDEYTLRLK